ncbi:uncharacterized protein FPRO_08663 [Fusarium proliferatum ET1]|uniref:Uncharacterized protein n=1 Tax=Fusarium proliferatum (strain ET1) TaxID=1227346 RepID=A0A1L7W3R7_FUSPR|nr:uncharacterized protein FPRO_08663 [Fusarium proliferatum ET1]CZR47289.1 uncharacterized protein FPRO_08663 [Fusarium proliferatum ET1]
MIRNKLQIKHQRSAKNKLNRGSPPRHDNWPPLIVKRQQEKGWTCKKSSGATNQDLQNAIDDFGLAFGLEPLTVKPRHCYQSLRMGKYFSLCNYGYLDSTEPVGRGNGLGSGVFLGEMGRNLNEKMRAKGINSHQVATIWGADPECHRIVHDFNMGSTDALITTYATLRIPGPEYHGECHRGFLLETSNEV